MHENLNSEQKKAVYHKDGPLLIIAGAGAGKTKTLTHRIFELIKSGVAPHNILAITFTNKAAGEMRARTQKLLEDEMGYMSDMPTLCTFHSLGVRILKEDGQVLGLKKHFTIADESDAIALIKEALKIAGFDPKQYEPKKVKSIISKEKGNFMTSESYGARAQSFFGKSVARVWSEYEKLLQKEQSVDFDDLLLKTVKILSENQEILEKYQERWKYIHIDEYQDTNEVQYKLATLLAKKYKNICVVGDSDQTIYSWRGANIKNILSFEEDYPNALVVLLEENYRSSKTILDAANEIIRHNKLRKEKNLFTSKNLGEKIGLYEGYDEKYEAEFVVDKATELIDRGVNPKDICVLYRANFQSRVFEDAFMTRGLPYHMLGTKFFDRKEVKDVLSYLRASNNPDSLSDIKRIINFPTRGIGKVTLVKLFSGEKESLPPTMQKKISNFYELLDDIREHTHNHAPSESLKYIIQKTGIESELKNGSDEDKERLENIKELVTIATKYDNLPPEEALDKLLEESSLMSDQDGLKDDQNGVRLMTVHSSKGLEFKYVFIVGLEHGLFPLERDGEGSKEIKEEERRLFYVAITRAEEKLFLSYATIRTIFGQRQINAPSEFLYDIPDELVHKEEWQSNLGRVVYLD